MPQFLWRLVRKCWTYHFLIPIALGFAIETLHAWYVGDIRAFTSAELGAYWSRHTITLLIEYAVFVVFLAHLVITEAAVEVTSIGALDDILPEAKSYFAIGTIPLDEWFEPATLMYFSHILEYHTREPGFHKRALLFFSRSSFRATKATYLDARYANCFAEMHRRLKVPLAYLDPKTSFNVIESLSPAQRKHLGWCWPWAIWFPGTLHWRIPGHCILRRRFRNLAFAAIDMKDGTQRVLLFRKHRGDLAVSELIDSAQRDAYLALSKTIRDLAFYEDRAIHKHNFQEFLCR